VAPATAVPPITTKLPSQLPNSLLATPFLVLPAYDAWPGLISITTVPPAAAEIRPAWIAAMQTSESSV
jgi:hypothetical protein